MPELSHYFAPILRFFQKNQRRLWLGSHLLVISFFAAKSVNLLLGHFFLPFSLDEDLMKSGVQQASQFDRPNTRRIIQRNLFDSSLLKEEPEIEEPEINDSDEIQPTSLNIELLGTIVFRNSRYSVALIDDQSENTTSYYSIGDRIQGATLVRIERFRIILQRAGRLEYAELQAAKIDLEESQPTRFSRSPSLPSRSDSSSSTDADFEELSPGRFLVPEQTVDNLMSNFAQILKDARAIPVQGEGGKLAGFRIVEIKNGSIYEKLGIQDGDVIKRVNGEDLDSFEKGTRLYTALRNEKTISIDIERSGSRLNYTYEIR